ncbi:MAG: cytochrome d ubiquinol oxidase subunit II [Odoribacter sp.]|nr:cytochrome d ubiquinol oxidase subunit II [Odoribacter sp.]
MTELAMFQAYWWLIIAVLGAALVFMLFVQGGQSMLYCKNDETSRQLMVNSLGRKWELTFTTLVVFGGAFFASFPLFYSTSFGGAYWLWLAILVSFVLQSVSYEYRRKRGNIYGTRTYDTFLLINGFFGCLLLGVAVASMFFGADFEVVRGNILDAGSPVISRWAPSRGLELMTDWRCLLLGITVFFLARTLAALYFKNNIKVGNDFTSTMSRKVLINGAIFTPLFVFFAIVLLLQSGLKADMNGVINRVDYLYFSNFMEMWWWGVIFASGVVLVLAGIIMGAFTSSCKGIWPAGVGTALVVIALFAVAGYNGTCYLPSNSCPQSSLTIANSSSSLYTLRTMSYVSIAVPFVLAYIIYVWRKMNIGGLTKKDIEGDSHQY